MRVTLSDTRDLTYATNVSEDLQPQAALLLARLATTAPAIAPKQQVQVRLDWGIVKLVRRNDEVDVEEPDYRADPRRFVSSITFTCAVLRAQQQVLERLHADPRPVHYDEGIFVYPGALTGRRIVAVRRDSREPADTGWYVFDGDRIDWGLEAQVVGVYEVPKRSPALMGILALPTGWAVRLEDATLTEAVPSQGARVPLRMAFDFPP